MFSQEFTVRGSDVKLEGFFVAKVVKNADPKAQERVFVRVLGVHDLENEDEEYGIWAQHCAPSKNAGGDVPDVDDWVYVFFMHPNDPMSCVWLGWVRTTK